MTLVFLVGKPSKGVITTVAVRLDEVSAPAEILSDRGKVDTAETLENTVHDSTPRVVVAQA